MQLLPAPVEQGRSSLSGHYGSGEKLQNQGNSVVGSGFGSYRHTFKKTHGRKLQDACGENDTTELGVTDVSSEEEVRGTAQCRDCRVKTHTDRQMDRLTALSLIIKVRRGRHTQRGAEAASLPASYLLSMAVRMRELLPRLASVSLSWQRETKGRGTDGFNLHIFIRQVDTT